MWITSSGSIAVWDPDNRRITDFGKDTTTHRVESSPDSPGNLEVFLGSTADDGILLASLYFGPREDEQVPDPWVLEMYDLDGTFRAHRGHVNGMWRYDRNPVPFSPIPWVAIIADSLYVSDSYDARIEVRDGTGMVARYLRLPAGSVDAEEAWEGLADQIRQRKDELAFGEAYLKDLARGVLPRDDRVPAVGGLLADTAGYLWVKSYDPGQDALWLRNNPLLPAPGGEWLVLDPADGHILGRVRLPDRLVPLQVTNTRVLGLTTDSWGIQRVVMHELVRQGH